MTTNEELQSIVEQAVAKLKAATNADTDNLAELVDLAIELIEDEQEHAANIQFIYDDLITKLSSEPEVMYMEYGRLVSKMFSEGLSPADEESLEFLKHAIDIDTMGDLWIRVSNENSELRMQLNELQKTAPSNDISQENDSSS